MAGAEGLRIEDEDFVVGADRGFLAATLGFFATAFFTGFGMVLVSWTR